MPSYTLLRSYPGPKLWEASRIPLIYWNAKAQLFYRVLDLHDKYDPVVRIAPNELSYIIDTAWKTIYGHRPVEMPKSLRGHGHFKPDNGVHGILTAPLKLDYSRMRRSILPAFSDRALRSQETFVIRMLIFDFKSEEMCSWKGAYWYTEVL